MTPLRELATLMQAQRALSAAQLTGVSHTIRDPLERVVDTLNESVKNRLRPPSKRKRGR